MPPILDAAIGTFFVFMLFSIAVTALNEVVLTFFDKRADFLRLGLGELLGDSQKNNQPGYVHKLVQYSSQKLDWVIGWALGLPIFAWSAGADGETVTLFGIIILVVLTRLGWFYAERQWEEKKGELDEARDSGNEGVAVTVQAKVQECEEQTQRKKTQFKSITIAGIAIAFVMGLTAEATLFSIASFIVIAVLVIWRCGGFSSLLDKLTGLPKASAAKEQTKTARDAFYKKQQDLNESAKDQQDSLNAKAVTLWRELLTEVVPQKRDAVQEEITRVETKSAQKLEELQKAAKAIQDELDKLVPQKAGAADAATLDALAKEEERQQGRAKALANQMQEIESEKDTALKELLKSLPPAVEALRAKTQQTLQAEASILQDAVDRDANTKQAELSDLAKAEGRLRPPLLSIPFLSLDPAQPPVNGTPTAPPPLPSKTSSATPSSSPFPKVTQTLPTSAGRPSPKPCWTSSCPPWTSP